MDATRAAVIQDSMTKIRIDRYKTMNISPHISSLGPHTNLRVLFINDNFIHVVVSCHISRTTDINNSGLAEKETIPSVLLLCSNAVRAREFTLAPSSASSNNNKNFNHNQ